VSTDVSFIL